MSVVLANAAPPPEVLVVLLLLAVAGLVVAVVAAWALLTGVLVSVTRLGRRTQASADEPTAERGARAGRGGEGGTAAAALAIGVGLVILVQVGRWIVDVLTAS